MIKVDIGCGRNKKKGFIGIDKYKAKGVNHIIDIEKEELPFKDNTIDYLIDFEKRWKKTQKAIDTLKEMVQGGLENQAKDYKKTVLCKKAREMVGLYLMNRYNRAYLN